MSLGVFLAIAGPVWAGGVAPETKTPASAELSRLSEDLIYSVDRTPERTFDTSRAVDVITGDSIRRANPANLADLLEEQAGIIIASSSSGGIPSIRGLANKQVMILVDGAKVNNATSGNTAREYLSLIDINQIDRVEVVRGVVSVLGTESLGGVINIITNKGAGAGDRGIGGSIGARYASADSSISVPLQFSGQTQKVRYDAGFTLGNFGNLHAPSAGEQNFSSYKARSGYLNGQFLLSPERTLSFGYQNVQQTDVQQPGPAGAFNNAGFRRSMQLGNLAYQDLTDRGWHDSVRVTGYWNRQWQVDNVHVLSAAALPIVFKDGDILAGLNLEIGSFVGNHHLIYGIDTSTDSVESSQFNTISSVHKRGNVMDGARYETLGAYVQDRFDASKWLTVIGGVRYGRFRTTGKEIADLGPINIDGSKADVTGALNLIAHITPRLNLIANAFRGFRAPNVDDTSHYNFVQVPGGIAFQVPSPNAEPEHVVSYEAGLKYEDGHLGGQVFYYRNRLTNLLTLAPGTFNGLPFRDTNGDGIRQKNEYSILQNQNAGSASIHGYELDGHYALGNGIRFWGNYSDGVGTDVRANKPLSAQPPGLGNLGVRWTSHQTHSPWLELAWRYYGTQESPGLADLKSVDLRNGKLPGFSVLHIRGGAAVTDRFSFTAGLENLGNKQYREVGSIVFAPSRQLVLGTQFRF